MISLSDIEFAKFQKLVYEKIGISMSDKKKSLLMSRLSKRLTFYNLKSYTEYYNLVLRDKEEFQAMINLVTTNETSFFREKPHFEFLKNRIQKNVNEPFRIWSAACSRGAEPYSIAMVLRENLHSKWEILASDIDSDVLNYAKEGVYPIDFAKHIPHNFLKKYCLKGENKFEGFFKVKDTMKENITFMQINLNNDFPKVGLFDIIFLRNVLIYFDNSKKKEIVENMAKLLKSDGLLITGHSETLFSITDKYKMVKSTVYQKV